MTTITCKTGDRIAIGGVIVEVVAVHGDKIHLGLEAPEEVLREIKNRKEPGSEKSRAAWAVDT